MASIYPAIITTVGLIIVTVVGKKMDNGLRDNEAYRKKREEMETLDKKAKYLLARTQLAIFDLILAISLDDEDNTRQQSIENARKKVICARKKYEEFVYETAHQQKG